MLPGQKALARMVLHPRSAQAYKQVAYTFFIRGLSIIIALLLTPLLLDALNKEKYGVWLTLSSILMWFSFFDIGLGNGLRNKLSEALALHQDDRARESLSTTYALLSLIFGGISLVFLAVNPFVHWRAVLNTEAIGSRELLWLTTIVFFFFMLRFVFQLIGIVFLASQKPALNSAMTTAGNILILLTVFVLTRFEKTPPLILLGFVLSAMPVLVMILFSLWAYRGSMRALKPAWHFVHIRKSGGILNLGTKFFIIQIAALLFFSTSNIWIAQYFGPAEVTIYNVAYQYYQIPMMLYAIVAAPFWSAVTEAYTIGDFAWLKETLRQLNRISIVFGLGVVIMTLLATPVYKLWLGSRVTIPWSLKGALALFALINIFSTPFTQFINGFGKLRLTLTVVIIGIVAYFPLVLLSIRIIGSSAAIVLAICVINSMGLVVQPIQIKKILNRSAFGIWNA